MAAGFPAASNIQSRLFDVPGAFEVGQPTYNADMLANVFSDTDLNRYQQVDSNANQGSFTFGYPTPIPTTSDFFFLLTEHLGSNTQFVEAFDTNNVSLGTVEVTAGVTDYTPSGFIVGFGQQSAIALISLDQFADAGDPARRIQSFVVTNANTNDGGDHKAFVIGNPLEPAAVKDSDLNNDPGPVTVDVLANDVAIGNFLPATVEITGSAGPGQPLVVPGQGTWSVDTGNGQITFTPNANFADDPRPITYLVDDDSPGTTNTATVTITYLINPELTLTKQVADVSDTNGSGTIGDAGRHDYLSLHR